MFEVSSKPNDAFIDADAPDEAQNGRRQMLKMISLTSKRNVGESETRNDQPTERCS
jgi:hypothetical protein